MRRREFLKRSVTAAAMVGMGMDIGAGSVGLGGERARPDRDGMLRVGGRRSFVLGLYQLPKREAALREASGAGFNLIHRNPDTAAYDEAWALGMKGWSSLGSLPEGAGAARAEGEKRIRGTIELLRGHPGLLFWETEDEPTFVWKSPDKVRVSSERILDTARFIRRHDPLHPLYLNHSPTHLVSTLREYNLGADIVATDVYPVIAEGTREMYALWPDGKQGDLSDSTIGQVGRYADKMRAVAGPGRAVFMVLQAFAWEDLREKDRDASKVIYPTRDQLRFMAWHSVVHGANGIVWWGLGYVPATSGLWDDLKVVVGELADRGEALSAPSLGRRLRLSYQDTGHSLERGVEWVLKPEGRGDRKTEILALVNADPNPVRVTIEGLGRHRRCEPLIGGREVDWRAGVLRERLEPHATRVWRLS